MENSLKYEIKIIHQLRFNTTTKESFIGYIVLLMLSKKLFSFNTDVSDLVFNSFGVKFLPYAVRSRTLMVAKVCKFCSELNTQEINHISIKVYDYLMSEVLPKKTNIGSDIVVNVKNENYKIKQKKNNALENMNLWIKNKNK
ncbi:hypothetical protein [Proteus faecis]|uniref:hypothetical protein n=1 Tax=Proteus faecis TaxID=2050967 RepID=UPI00301C00A2